MGYAKVFCGCWIFIYKLEIFFYSLWCLLMTKDQASFHAFWTSVLRGRGSIGSSLSPRGSGLVMGLNVVDRCLWGPVHNGTEVNPANPGPCQIDWYFWLAKKHTTTGHRVSSNNIPSFRNVISHCCLAVNWVSQKVKVLWKKVDRLNLVYKHL